MIAWDGKTLAVALAAVHTDCSRFGVDHHTFE